MFKNLSKIFDREFFKKDIALSICCALIFSLFFSLAGFDMGCEDLRKNILRLHILANSDSKEDQGMKLEIRDCLLSASNGIFDNIESKEDAKVVANQNLDKFKKIAENVVKSHGKDYNVDIKIEKAYFDTRRYENFTLPAGEYDALRVLVGEAKGKNWWCIMFPAMCIPAASDNKTLDQVTNKDTKPFTTKGNRYVIKFKAVEIYQKLRNKNNTV